MKNFIPALCMLMAIGLFSCSEDEKLTEGLKKQNLESLIQTFTFDLNSSNNDLSVETDAGCRFTFYPSGFECDGMPVTGSVNIDIIEIFDKGTMAITGKHTMTEDAILISGGEFHIRAYQDNKNIDYNRSYIATIPSNLASPFSNEMQLFKGGGDIDTAQDWVLAPNATEQLGLFPQDDSTYFLILDGFEWFNCDRFMNDPRPTTELTIRVPTEFNSQNLTVYLAIQNEESSLGIANQGVFPIGLDVHLIFIAEQDDQFLYQIISTTVSDVDEYTFERKKMQTATPEELKKIVNGLQ